MTRDQWISLWVYLGCLVALGGLLLWAWWTA